MFPSSSLSTFQTLSILISWYNLHPVMSKSPFLEECPVCKESRYKSGSKSVARKRFKCLPLETRLRRLFGNERASTLIQCHNKENKDTESTCVSSIHESLAWKKWNRSAGCYNGPQSCNIRSLYGWLRTLSKKVIAYGLSYFQLS